MLSRLSSIIAPFALSACAHGPATQPSATAAPPKTEAAARIETVRAQTSSRSAAALQATQGLTPDEVRSVVIARLGAIRSCTDLMQKSDASSSHRISIAWEVGADGTVSRATIVESTFGDPRVEGCMRRVVLRLKFSEAARPTRVQFPFVYYPQPMSDAGSAQ